MKNLFGFAMRKGVRLSDIDRARLEQRVEELEAELRWVQEQLSSDTSARLREQQRWVSPQLERGRWTGGRWWQE